MGLDTTHDAFHGPYSRFERLRAHVRRAIWATERESGPAASLVEWDETRLPEETRAGFQDFICHSDCDGEHSPDVCISIAAALEYAADRITPIGTEPYHIQLAAQAVGDARAFAAGARRAAAAGEPIEYH